MDTMYSKDGNFYIARFEVQVLGKELNMKDLPWLNCGGKLFNSVCSRSVSDGH